MTNFTEQSQWEAGVYQLDVADPVQGGTPGFSGGVPVTGFANAAAKQLTNRTRYLKDTHEAFVSDLTNTTDPTKGAAMVGWVRSTRTHADDVGSMLSASATNIWEFSHLVVDRPVALDPGTWDWTPALQAAVDSFGPTTRMSIYIPSGWYKIRTVYIKRSNFCIFGDSPGSTILGKFSSDEDFLIKVASQAWLDGTYNLSTRVTGSFSFRNLSFAGEANTSGLYLGGCGFDGYMYGCSFSFFGYSAVVMDDVWDCQWVACRFISCASSPSAEFTHAVMMDGKFDSTNAQKFIGCHFEGNLRGSLRLINASAIQVVAGTKMEANGTTADWSDIDIDVNTTNLNDGILIDSVFVARNATYPKHWITSAARNLKITNCDLRTPTEVTGALWFKILPTEDGTDVIGALIANNTIYAHGGLSEYPFDFGQRVHVKDNHIRIYQANKAYKIGPSCIIDEGSITCLGTATSQTGLFELGINIANHQINVKRFITPTKLYNNAIAVPDATRLRSKVTLDIDVTESNQLVSITEGFDPFTYDTHRRIFHATSVIAFLKRSTLGQELTIRVTGAGALNTGGNMYLSSSATNCTVTLKSIQGDSKAGWLEVARSVSV